MMELLFFLLGLIIGVLSGIVFISMSELKYMDKHKKVLKEKNE